MNVSTKPHVVLVPFPALGHSIPFLDLARLLALHGATVSYVTTPANASRLEGAMAEAQSAGLAVSAVVLPTPAVEGLPEGRESTDVLPSELVGLLVNLAEKLAEPFERWLHQQLQQDQEQKTGPSPPVCIISDILMLWTLQIGEKYGIRRVLFNTCGAFALTLLYSVSSSLSKNALQKEGDIIILSMNLPSPLRFNKNEIASNFFEPDMSNPLQHFVIRCLQSLSQGWGMLINTFEDLEPVHLRHMRSLTGKPILSIGPVLPPIFAGKTCRGKMADISEDELVRWLDSQRRHSVVYVSFGSQAVLSERQTVALARGLEASGQPFVWAIKCPPKLEPTTAAADTAAADGIQAYLPHGFEDRMKNKELGLIIWGWAPQLLILSHPSVGAFMSHCGWNSTLESITLGVPLITWPMSGDQNFNSKQVAEQFAIGVEFCQHRDGIPEEKRVTEVVRLVLTEDEGEEMRRRANKLKEIASQAVEQGGSSQVNLQAFLCEM